MPKKSSANPSSTPALKKTPSSGGQKTLLGFFSKTPSSGSPAALPALPAKKTATAPAPLKNRSKSSGTASGSSLTPVPSSDGPQLEDEEEDIKASSPAARGLPSPVSADEGQTNGLDELNARGTPSRKVLSHDTSTGAVTNLEQAKKKTVNYVESDTEGTDDDVFKPKPVARARPTKRRRLSDSADEDVYQQENAVEQEDDGTRHLRSDRTTADNHRHGRLHCS